MCERAKFIVHFWILLLAFSVYSTRALADSPQDIARRVSPSVILLLMEDAQGHAISMGSAFVVSQNVVATNVHVIEGAVQGKAKTQEQSTELEVKGILGIDSTRDLVLLAIEGIQAPALPLADSNQVQVGDTVYVVGNPQGLERTFSAGIVSSIRTLCDETLLQITAPISAGSSGGPVMNDKGEVIGVAVGAIEGGQNLNFAVPSAVLSALLASQKELMPLSVVPRNAREMNQEVRALVDAANLGEAKAMYELAESYSNGRGVTRNVREALNWYVKSAIAGFPRAMWFVGELCAHSDDHEAALVWWQKAADGGDTDAMCNIGQMYSGDREGLAIDRSEAIKWLRKAAGGGNPRAMSILAVYCESGWSDATAAEGIVWLNKAVDAGHIGAMWQLGSSYEFGIGVTKDLTQAFKWYRRAAENGDINGMISLADLYSKGKGVHKDTREAFRWYKEAAMLGDSGAIYKVAEAYKNGSGIPKNDVEAYAWFAIAAAFGEGTNEVDEKLQPWGAGTRSATRARDEIARNLPPEARYEAEQRAQQIFEQISKPRTSPAN